MIGLVESTTLRLVLDVKADWTTNKMSKDIHVHIHEGDSNAKPVSKVSTTKPVDKRKQAVKGAKIALNFHGREMFKSVAGFFKHFLLTLFYLLRLLGFALQTYGKAYNKKHSQEDKKQDEGFKWWKEK